MHVDTKRDKDKLNKILKLPKKRLNLSLKNNILIIGGTGFIGYHLAKKSLKKGWKVTSISSRLPRKKRYLPKVKYILCDITKKNLLKKNIRKTFNYVVNLGGYVDHSNKKKNF